MTSLNSSDLDSASVAVSSKTPRQSPVIFVTLTSDSKHCRNLQAGDRATDNLLSVISFRVEKLIFPIPNEDEVYFVTFGCVITVQNNTHALKYGY